MSDNKIVETLALMCDKNNPQDKKLLLLAELVETKCEALGKNQEELKGSLKVTNEKLDKLTNLLEKYQNDKDMCPVYKDRKSFEKIAFFMRYPKVSLLVILGIFAMLVGLFSSSFTDLIKFLFGV